MKEQNMRGRAPDGGKVHIGFGLLHDQDAAEASCELDAAADREWFREHPGETERVREASVLERVAFRLAAGTRMRVKLLTTGEQVRIAIPPLGQSVSVFGTTK